MSKIETALTREQETLASKLAGKYSVAKCFVSFLLFLSVSYRTAFKTWLQQQKARYAMDLSKISAEALRFDLLSRQARATFDTINAKIQSYVNLFDQIPFREFARDCKEASDLVYEIIEGVGTLRKRMFPTLQAELQYWEDQVVKYTALTTYTETTKQAIIQSTEKFNKYIEMIDAMNAL